MTKRDKLPKPVKAWAGVCEGKLHRWPAHLGNYYEIYRTRAEAEEHYEQVVRVTINPQSK